MGAFLFTDEFASTNVKIKKLKEELEPLEASLIALEKNGGEGFFNNYFFGKKDEIESKIKNIKAQISSLIEPIKSIPKDQPKINSASVGVGAKLYDAIKPKTDAVGKSENTGVQVLLGLEKDYQNELAKRVDALNAPLLSASERKLADDMRNVSKRAQDSRVELEKLNISGTLSLENYHARMQDVTRDEIAQRAAIAELAAEQDKLNASFEYGAQVALRNYLDEVANKANQSETLMKNAFKGMEDALVSFVKTGKLDFSSLADSIISDLIRIQIRASITGPLAGILAGWGSKRYSGGADGYTLPSGESTMSANGNVFSGRGISAYSNQIVTKPTNFFANGGNVMGEAGPEAIMPLKRDSSGRLGVRASGGSSLVYSPTVNIDSRTDRAEVQRLVDSSIQQGHAMLVDKLQRQGVL